MVEALSTGTNGRGFKYWTEWFKEVHTKGLLKTFGNQACFVLIQGSTNLKFCLNFVLKSHLHLTTFISSENGTRSQVWLCIKA